MRIILKRCGTPCRLRNGNITLYTARHPFSANAKSDGLTREEVAALMGHASIYTAGTHYGKRRSGHGGLGMHVDGEKVRARGQLLFPDPSHRCHSPRIALADARPFSYHQESLL